MIHLDPPDIQIIKTEDNIVSSEPGFLEHHRVKLRLQFPDDSISEEFNIDYVSRKSMDAVVIIGHYLENNIRYVYLRSTIRIPLTCRNYENSGVLEDMYVGHHFELPAGLVDDGELGVKGLSIAAAREFKEEVGFNYPSENFNLLGKRTFSTIGIAAERLFYYEIEVNPRDKKLPSLDGHPLEEFGQVIPVSMEDCKKLLDSGYLYDSKTEIGLRRFFEKYK
jgi:8-oxo-dGTP pyrophosphatase MutT (NUDIX family)